MTPALPMTDWIFSIALARSSRQRDTCLSGRADHTARVRTSRCLSGAFLITVCLLPSSCSRPPEAGDARGPGASVELPAVEANELRPLSAFTAVPAGPARAAALFTEASRVLAHPRCINCHVEGDSPAQGMAFERHEPPVVRGAEDRGVVGMECSGCHQDRNLELARVPGAPDWRLPPRVMAWAGRTPEQLCEQLKDAERNGGRTLAEVVDHAGHDAFVAWGWAPGADRISAPGSQQEFAAILAGWVDNGGACPTKDGVSDG